MVGKYAKGRYKELGNLAIHFSGDVMEIDSAEEMVVNVDGEALYAKKVVFRLIKGGVRFIFPKGMTFFASDKEENRRETEKNRIERRYFCSKLRCFRFLRDFF